MAGGNTGLATFGARQRERIGKARRGPERSESLSEEDATVRTTASADGRTGAEPEEASAPTARDRDREEPDPDLLMTVEAPAPRPARRSRDRGARSGTDPGGLFGPGASAPEILVTRVIERLGALAGAGSRVRHQPATDEGVFFQLPAPLR